MAQATVLAAGTSAATSTTITVAAAAVRVSIFASGVGEIPPTATLTLQQIGPLSALTPIGTLSKSNPTIVLNAPGGFSVKRPAMSVAVGVYTE